MLVRFLECFSRLVCHPTVDYQNYGVLMGHMHLANGKRENVRDFDFRCCLGSQRLNICGPEHAGELSPILSWETYVKTY